MKFISDRPQVHKDTAEWGKLDLPVFAAEPSVFSASPRGLKMIGGPLAKIALGFVEEHYAPEIKRAEGEGLLPVIDVRVQRLMVGMYPSIPGWHCDAVPRSSYHGQPDFDLIRPHAFHVCLLLSSDKVGVSNTKFVDETAQYSLWNEPKRTVYKQLHDEVEKRNPKILTAADGQFVKFTPRTIHKAAPTHRRGWRMFFRFSMYHNPPLENLVPNVQQVYLLSEANGW